jgi:hypothetical protein
MQTLEQGLKHPEVLQPTNVLVGDPTTLRARHAADDTHVRDRAQLNPSSQHLDGPMRKSRAEQDCHGWPCRREASLGF